MMPVGSMRMMRRQFVFASTMMFGCLTMMLRGMFMVFSGLRVMFFKFLRHCISFFFEPLRTSIPRISDFVHAKSTFQRLNSVRDAVLLCGNFSLRCQPMKSTAPPRNAFSVIATTPCRGLSPSR
jgi:hypothetical protein